MLFLIELESFLEGVYLNVKSFENEDFSFLLLV